jgi:integrase
MTRGSVVVLRKEVAPQRQTPQRRPNGELRTREHLTEREVERLIEAAKGNRHGHRDATMTLLAFRHGLRASELVALRWDQVDFSGAVLHVRRVKQGSLPIANRQRRGGTRTRIASGAEHAR